MTSVFKVRHKATGRYAKKHNYDPLNISVFGGVTYDRKPPIGDVWNSYKVAKKFLESIPYIYKYDAKMEEDDFEVVEFELVEKK